jgi:hypothetical protein
MVFGFVFLVWVCGTEEDSSRDSRNDGPSFTACGVKQTDPMHIERENNSLSVPTTHKGRIN